jgi:putative transposase
MTLSTSSLPYAGYRFPAESIGHAVWLYERFSLSYRDVEELLAARGVVLTYETVRQWCHTFGQSYARVLRRRRAQTGDKWHLDESSSKSMASSILCGTRLISTAMC